jgi:hypothetical protein
LPEANANSTSPPKNGEGSLAAYSSAPAYSNSQSNVFAHSSYLLNDPSVSITKPLTIDDYANKLKDCSNITSTPIPLYFERIKAKNLEREKNLDYSSSVYPNIPTAFPSHVYTARRTILTDLASIRPKDLIYAPFRFFFFILF